MWLPCTAEKTTEKFKGKKNKKKGREKNLKNQKKGAASSLLLKNNHHPKLFFFKYIPVPTSQNQGFEITPQGKTLFFLEASTLKPRLIGLGHEKQSPSFWILGGKDFQPTLSEQISAICHHFPALWSSWRGLPFLFSQRTWSCQVSEDVR